MQASIVEREWNKVAGGRSCRRKSGERKTKGRKVKGASSRDRPAQRTGLLGLLSYSKTPFLAPLGPFCPLSFPFLTLFRSASYSLDRLHSVAFTRFACRRRVMHSVAFPFPSTLTVSPRLPFLFSTRTPSFLSFFRPFGIRDETRARSFEPRISIRSAHPVLPRRPCPTPLLFPSPVFLLSAPKPNPHSSAST